MEGASAALIFGLFAIFFRAKLLTAIAFFAAAVVFAVMSASLGSLGLTLIAAVAVGALGQGCATGLFSIAPDCYPAGVRTTDVGWAVTVGRIGAVAAPIIAGVLFDHGWTPAALYLLFAIPLIFGGIAIIALRLPSTAGAAVSQTADEVVD